MSMEALDKIAMDHSQGYDEHSNQQYHIPVLGANDEVRPSVKKRKTFCLVFSLQTGMSVIFLLDCFLLAFLCCNYGVNYMDGYL